MGRNPESPGGSHNPGGGPSGNLEGIPGAPGGGGGLPQGPPGGGGIGGAGGATRQPQHNAKLMGQLPAIFDGDCSCADRFIDKLKDYFHLNVGSLQF